MYHHDTPSLFACITCLLHLHCQKLTYVHYIPYSVSQLIDWFKFPANSRNKQFLRIFYRVRSKSYYYYYYGVLDVACLPDSIDRSIVTQ